MPARRDDEPDGHTAPVALRVDVAPALLAWAVERSGRDPGDLDKKFPKLAEWLSGNRRPTLRQLELFANATYTPVGSLFLEAPPDEVLPLPDFRTFPSADLARPSPDLLDTIYMCEQRQDWFARHQREMGAEPLPFVNSVSAGDDVEATAAAIRAAVSFDLGERRDFKSWAEALRELVERTEEAGILVMVNGVVGANTHRKLDPEEFRGFALVDSHAPVVFINNVDWKAAQIFTLVHELAHIWAGEPAVSNMGFARRTAGPDVERWCNAVAGEVLVPRASLDAEFQAGGDLVAEADRMAHLFRVSTLVVLRRMADADFITWADYEAAAEAQLKAIRERSAGSGGNFYTTAPVRLSKRFSRTVISDTLEGRTLYREAFQLLGVRKVDTFHGLADQLGVS